MLNILRNTRKFQFFGYFQIMFRAGNGTWLHRAQVKIKFDALHPKYFPPKSTNLAHTIPPLTHPTLWANAFPSPLVTSVRESVEREILIKYSHPLRDPKKHFEKLLTIWFNETRKHTTLLLGRFLDQCDIPHKVRYHGKGGLNLITTEVKYKLQCKINQKMPGFSTYLSL